MDPTNLLCPQCGYIFNNFYQSLFSERFASHYSENPPVRYIWCFNCAKAIIMRPPFWLLRIIGRGKDKTEVMSLDEFIDHPLSQLKNPGMAFNCGENLLRMIWHCLLEKAKKIHDEDDAPKEAMNLALEKIYPPAVGLMACIVANASNCVPLEQSLAECTYTSETIYPSLVRDWILTSQSTDRAEAAAEVFDKLMNMEN